MTHNLSWEIQVKNPIPQITNIFVTGRAVPICSHYVHLSFSPPNSLVRWGYY